MALSTAFYYPHARIESEALLAQALLLWDRVEYIAPYEGWSFPSANADIHAAVELVVVPHVPTVAEQKRAHDDVAALVEKGLPAWFFLRDVGDNPTFGIYPEKFAPQTWSLLHEAGLAAGRPGTGEVTYDALGMTLLATLADACAGTKKRLLTDRAHAYAIINRFLAALGSADTVDAPSPEYDRLVTVSLQAIDVRTVPLASLVRLREREDANLRKWRHAYLERLERQVEALSDPYLTEGDRMEMERSFHQELQDDLSVLRGELRTEGLKAVLSKEFATAAALVTAGVVIPAVAFLPAALGAGAALWRKHAEYTAARKKILGAHSMSWLYNLSRFQRW